MRSLIKRVPFQRLIGRGVAPASGRGVAALRSMREMPAALVPSGRMQPPSVNVVPHLFTPLGSIVSHSVNNPIGSRVNSRTSAWTMLALGAAATTALARTVHAEASDGNQNSRIRKLACDTLCHAIIQRSADLSGTGADVFALAAGDVDEQTLADLAYVAQLYKMQLPESYTSRLEEATPSVDIDDRLVDILSISTDQRLTAEQVARIEKGELAVVQQVGASYSLDGPMTIMFFKSKETGELVEQKIDWREFRTIAIAGAGENMPKEKLSLVYDCIGSYGGVTIKNADKSTSIRKVNNPDVWLAMLEDCVLNNRVSKLDLILSHCSFAGNVTDTVVQNISLSATNGRVRLLQVFQQYHPHLVMRANADNPLVDKLLAHPSKAYIEKLSRMLSGFGKLDAEAEGLLLEQLKQRYAVNANDAKLRSLLALISATVDGQPSLYDERQESKDEQIFEYMAKRFAESKVLSIEYKFKQPVFIDEKPTGDMLAALHAEPKIYVYREGDDLTLYAYDDQQEKTRSVKVEGHALLQDSLQKREIDDCVIEQLDDVLSDSDIDGYYEENQFTPFLQEFAKKDGDCEAFVVFHGAHYTAAEIRKRGDHVYVLYADSLNFGFLDTMMQSLNEVFGADNASVYVNKIRVQHTSVSCSIHCLRYGEFVFYVDESLGYHERYAHLPKDLRAISYAENNVYEITEDGAKKVLQPLVMLQDMQSLSKHAGPTNAISEKGFWRLVNEEHKAYQQELNLPAAPGSDDTIADVMAKDVSPANQNHTLNEWYIRLCRDAFHAVLGMTEQEVEYAMEGYDHVVPHEISRIQH